MIAALFLFSSNVQAACDGLKMNKKKTKVSIKNLRNASDGCGGGAHLFKKHIGISDDDLKKRAPNLSGGVASTFDDESAARKAIAKVLRSNMSQVKKIMSGTSNREEIEGKGPVKGTCVNEACATVVKDIKGSKNVFVLLRANGNGADRKVRIQTAFPRVKCKCK